MKLLLKIVISATLLAGISISGYSQISNATDIHIKKLLMLVDDVGFSKVINPDSSTIEGSPFLDQEFMNGSITTPEGKEFIEIPLRYNIFNDNFEFHMENKAYSLEADRFARIVTLDNRTFVYISYRYKDREREGYLELVRSGMCNFYRRYRLTFDPPQEPLPYQDAVPGKFKSLTPYFLISYGDTEPETIQNKKKLIEFGNLSGVNIKKFLKANRINIRQEEDIIKVVDYLNANR